MGFHQNLADGETQPMSGRRSAVRPGMLFEQVREAFRDNTPR